MERYVMKNQKRLRCGITTGTCAAAAAKAAAELFLAGRLRQEISILTPKGVEVSVPVSLVSAQENGVCFRVIKDSGDDPDVTDGTAVEVSLKRAEPAEISPETFHDSRFPRLYLDGGRGVGRVTQKGLEQEVGRAAINPVPRSMIFQAVDEVRALTEPEEALLILVSVPEGEWLAERTFNPRLGISGGLSILGTSGILEPMSEKAIVDTIALEIGQLARLGKKRLLVMPGNYGQSYAQEYLRLDLENSVRCSNYIGETIDLAAGYGMESFLLVGNIGKLVKLAAGIMNTHSRTADGRGEIMAVHAVLCGADRETAAALMSCINTDEMLSVLEEQGIREAVIKSLCEKIQEHLNRRSGGQMRCGAALFSERFGFLGQTEEAAGLLEEYRRERR